MGAAFCVVRKRETAASCGFPAARLGAVRCAQGNDLLSQGALRVCHTPSSHRICCPYRIITPLGAAPMRAFLPVAPKRPYAMAAEKRIIMRAPHSPHAAPSVAQDPHPGQTIPPKSRSFLLWIFYIGSMTHARLPACNARFTGSARSAGRRLRKRRAGCPMPRP